MNATAFDLTNAVRIYDETIAPLHQQYLSEDNAVSYTHLTLPTILRV